MLNPFANENCAVSDSKFVVCGNGYDVDENWFTLIDKESGVSFSTTRDKDVFFLNLHIPIKSKCEINVYHYFDKRGEEIVFEKYDKSGLVRFNYNLKEETFEKLYGEKHIATTKDKKFVIDSLNECIAFARDFVSKNIDTKSNEVGIVLKK